MELGTIDENTGQNIGHYKECMWLHNKWNRFDLQRENNVFEFLFWNLHRTKIWIMFLSLISFLIPYLMPPNCALFSSSRISNSHLVLVRSRSTPSQVQMGGTPARFRQGEGYPSQVQMGSTPLRGGVPPPTRSGWGGVPRPGMGYRPG